MDGIWGGAFSTWQIRALDSFIRLGGLFPGKRIVSKSLRVRRQVRVPHCVLCVSPGSWETHRSACKTGKTPCRAGTPWLKFSGAPLMDKVGDMARSQAQLSRFGEQDQGSER